MKTTVKHVGSGGVWEGLIENYNAHKDVIEHWCEGGDIQIVLIGGAGNGDDYYRDVTGPEFPHDLVFRIKQREPKPGEVWILGKNKTPAMKTEIEQEFSNLKTFINCDFYGEKFYAAPSVEAYYAREFLKRRNDGPLTCTVLQDAALLNT